MEKKGTSMFQFSQDQSWNIVELEARRQLRRTVNTLIDLVDHSSLTTSEIKQQLQQQHERFGRRFATQLVRALQRDDASERQAIVWLLTLLGDQETILPLQQLAQNDRISRSIRLSASFALAGLGATPEVQAAQSQRTHARLYAIS